MMSPLTRDLIGQVLPPTVVSAAAFATAGATALTVQGFVGAGVLPSPGPALQVWLGLLPAVLVLTLPVSLLFGVVSTARTWREQGEMMALSTAGLGPRALLPGLLILGITGGLAEAGLAHGLEPAGRSWARAGMSRAAADIRILAGQPVQLPGLLVHAAEARGRSLGQVFAATETMATVAERGRLASDGQLILERGAALSLPPPGGTQDRPWTLAYDRIVLSLGLAGARVDPPQLSSRELMALAERMEARGRAPLLERTTLYKRSVFPLEMVVVALLGLPLGARGSRPARTVVLVALLWWASVRICDQAVHVLGPAASVAVPAVLLAMATAWAWIRWPPFRWRP